VKLGIKTAADLNDLETDDLVGIPRLAARRILRKVCPSAALSPLPGKKTATATGTRETFGAKLDSTKAAILQPPAATSSPTLALQKKMEELGIPEVLPSLATMGINKIADFEFASPTMFGSDKFNPIQASKLQSLVPETRQPQSGNDLNAAIAALAMVTQNQVNMFQQAEKDRKDDAASAERRHLALLENLVEYQKEQLPDEKPEEHPWGKAFDADSLTTMSKLTSIQSFPACPPFLKLSGELASISATLLEEISVDPDPRLTSVSTDLDKMLHRLILQANQQKEYFRDGDFQREWAFQFSDKWKLYPRNEVKKWFEATPKKENPKAKTGYATDGQGTRLVPDKEKRYRHSSTGGRDGDGRGRGRGRGSRGRGRGDGAASGSAPDGSS
jgi:hypothetical protein